METIQNAVQLVGRTGQDLEVQSTTNSKKYVRFSIATNEVYKDATGEKKTETHWHNLVAWGKQAELLAEYVKKGQQLAVQGKLQSRSYETKEGEKRYITEVLVRDFMFLG